MTSPKKIKTIGDRCLRQKSEEVVFEKNAMNKLYMQMCDAMWEADGIGLAAPQIGINKRVIIVDETTEEHGKYAHLMVNPKITWKSEEKVLFDELKMPRRKIYYDFRKSLLMSNTSFFVSPVGCFCVCFPTSMPQVLCIAHTHI